MSALKAVVGGAVAALTIAGPPAGDGLTLQDWPGVALAGLTSIQVVFWASNRPRR